MSAKAIWGVTIDDNKIAAARLLAAFESWVFLLRIACGITNLEDDVLEEDDLRVLGVEVESKIFEPNKVEAIDGLFVWVGNE